MQASPQTKTLSQRRQHRALNEEIKRMKVALEEHEPDEKEAGESKSDIPTKRCAPSPE